MSRYACPCCGVDGTTESSRKAFERLEDEWGALVLTSAYRCEKHNRAVKGALKSQHLFGKAFDVKMTNSHKRIEFIQKARECGFRGFGLGVWGVHIDDRACEATWVY